MLNNKKLLIPFITILCISIILFLISIITIGKSVKENCLLAKSKYSGDCVEAHLQYLQKEELNTMEWVSFIWSLGQLSDEKAVTFLRRSVENNPCDKENKQNCIYEAKKALKWSTTNKNILSPIWRTLFL